MQTGLAALLLAGPLAGFSPTAKAAADALSEAAGSYRIDGSSSIRFAVDQVGGGGIRGSFPDYKGTFRIDGSNVGKSNVTITLYPKSVQANEVRVERFLRSDAVFDVENYPEITFRFIRGATDGGVDGTDRRRADGARQVAQGRVRGGCQPPGGGGSISFHVTGAIYRSPYGMGVGTPVYSNLVKFDMTLNGTKN